MLWFMSDSKLTARDKALVAFGAAAATHCPYWVPFHTEQLRLSGMAEEEITEAAGAVQQSAGASAYLAGIGYNTEKFQEELSNAVEYIKSKSKWPQRRRNDVLLLHLERLLCIMATFTYFYRLKS
jgi:AhpD family alkylhydroperoxidase